jgi:hypothetical protein
MDGQISNEILTVAKFYTVPDLYSLTHCSYYLAPKLLVIWHQDCRDRQQDAQTTLALLDATLAKRGSLTGRQFWQGEG